MSTAKHQSLQVQLIENVDGRFLILANDGIGGHLRRGDRWEPHFTSIVQHVLRPGDIAVDIGANMGCNTVQMAKAVGPTGMVYAFEPQRITFQQLCGNVFLNQLTNVYTIQCALGSRAGEHTTMKPVDYFADWVNIGDNRIGPGGEPVMLGTLDSFGLGRPSFIKIDVQGYEIEVLKGAEKTIERNRPLLFVEVEEPHLRDMGVTATDLIGHILSLGYVMAWIKNDYPVDHLCIPVERKDLALAVGGWIGAPVQVIE